MRVLGVQWSRALSLVCEVALSSVLRQALSENATMDIIGEVMLVSGGTLPTLLF